jgi:hypothetical protein
MVADDAAGPGFAAKRNAVKGMQATEMQSKREQRSRACGQSEQGPVQAFRMRDRLRHMLAVWRFLYCVETAAHRRCAGTATGYSVAVSVLSLHTGRPGVCALSVRGFWGRRMEMES